MLKLNYTESGLYMERVAAPLEVLVAQRVVIALRAGKTLFVQPGRASFLIPNDAPGLVQLELALKLEHNDTISVAPVDQECLEVGVQGSWLAETIDAEEGTFITAFSDRSEFFVYKLWQATQPQASFMV
ncbi:alr0857 family protein [Pantanalinema rosaneae CENA516]|uniref:alr0857 family protein n=1 Tax=Pantanalinema rosaneae TaxID=1620701 RepID=UPI003D6E1F39